jgi:hypothetical protein
MKLSVMGRHLASVDASRISGTRRRGIKERARHEKASQREPDIMAEPDVH